MLHLNQEVNLVIIVKSIADIWAKVFNFISSFIFLHPSSLYLENSGGGSRVFRSFLHIHCHPTHLQMRFSLSFILAPMKIIDFTVFTCVILVHSVLKYIAWLRMENGMTKELVTSRLIIWRFDFFCCFLLVQTFLNMR